MVWDVALWLPRCDTERAWSTARKRVSSIWACDGTDEKLQQSVEHGIWLLEEARVRASGGHRRQLPGDSETPREVIWSLRGTQSLSFRLDFKRKTIHSIKQNKLWLFYQPPVQSSRLHLRLNSYPSATKQCLILYGYNFREMAHPPERANCNFKIKLTAWCSLRP